MCSGEGPAAHHTILGDSFLRSGRPIKTARTVEKTLKVPRTPKTPAKTPAVPQTYQSGDQTFKMPPCSLEHAHSTQLGHGRISVKAAFSGATLFITGASGYVGSVVLEQLLRFSPDVTRIYLLIRGKRGNTGVPITHPPYSNSPTAQQEQQIRSSWSFGCALCVSDIPRDVLFSHIS
jgi:fatty acyl-CoA reductase